jgi:hypothetical protein
MTITPALVRVFISTTLTMLLTACDGGAGGSTVGNNFSISGTAATDGAISDRTVEARCASETGTATTNYDGTFVISVNNGNLFALNDADTLLLLVTQSD